MEKRIQWAELPDALRDAITARTGQVISGRAVTDGKNSPLAAVIETRNGKMFVKGLPSGHLRVITQSREASAAPLVKGLSPALLDRFDEADWNVNIFEYIEGRSADYSPGSPNIERVTDLMTALSAIKVPGRPGPWKPIETRMRTYVDDPADAALFTGQTLTHTDWMPDNVLITHSGAKLIDWAWATPADAWTDPAFWLLRLIAHGHSAQQAETVASRLPAYAAADPARVDLFARVRPCQRPRLGRDQAEQPNPVDKDDGLIRLRMGTASGRSRRIKLLP